jgi:hypothetical protein
MPRYFFNTHDGEDIIDDEGLDLPGLTEARAQAIAASGEILRDRGKAFWDGTEWMMRVLDEAGDVVCVLKFSAEEGGADVPAARGV